MTSPAPSSRTGRTRPGKPAVPVPYAQETMHGMEYAFGQMLMLSGMLDEGVRVVAAVRDRYDGAKRNPWNEIECGSNYARSMASWGSVLVLSGFAFDAGRGYIGFQPRLRDADGYRSIWSGPGAYGMIDHARGRGDPGRPGRHPRPRQPRAAAPRRRRGDRHP